MLFHLLVCLLFSTRMNKVLLKGKSFMAIVVYVYVSVRQCVGVCMFMCKQGLLSKRRTTEMANS